MLINLRAEDVQEIYVCAGYTDLRKSIDGLVSLLENTYEVNPYREAILYLFCGRTASYKIKGLLYEKNGFLLFHKRLKEGRYHWIRDESKGLIRISHEQFLRLMNEGRLN
ncbi:MAG: IS66 family insertion sequence element accessory protein TnpB [Clostridia bacterium]|nr:IS66 family insertion sequence element accessory protein TnpB [Clostridia bacterium]